MATDPSIAPLEMSAFDYNAEAELFPSSGQRGKAVGYKRFAHAADALRFAMEQLPPEALAGAWLEINEMRFDAVAMKRLYDRAEYPLKRGPPALPAAGSPGAAAKGFSGQGGGIRWRRP